MRPSFTTALVSLIFASNSVADPGGSSDLSKRILGRWLGSRKFEIYYADGTWAVQRNENSKPDKEGRHWQVDGNKLILTYPGGKVSETILFMNHSKFVTDEEGHKDKRIRAE